MIWTEVRPTVSGYYWAEPCNRSDWLVGIPEVAYVYFDSEWKVIRPGLVMQFRLDHFSRWCGPLPMPDAT